ncbi:MAG TPA: hypothetical protein VGU71_09165 [Candidatus Dormibacteraeota bacterium]|nr:hypothetical protein [Candidatus Dormibacteraeota bacterium]
MSKLGRLWNWLLPGLIYLSPIGAIAYDNAATENEAPDYESKRAGRRALVSDAPRRGAVIPLARL